MMLLNMLCIKCIGVEHERNDNSSKDDSECNSSDGDEGRSIGCFDGDIVDGND